MSIEWQERFSLHHEKIDLQHKELFRLAKHVSKLDEETTTKEDIASIFKEFFNYMKEHFTDEEAYMQSIGYPALAKHQELHQAIIHDVTSILKEKKNIIAMQESIKIIARKWLIEHILENDLKIEQWRKETYRAVN